MLKRLQKLVWTGPLLLAASAIGSFPGAALAQGGGFPPAGSGFGTLSIQRFALQGTGCPSGNGARASLQTRRNTQMLVVTFSGAGVGAFQVNGGGARSCTMRFMLDTGLANSGFDGGGFAAPGGLGAPQTPGFAPQAGFGPPSGFAPPPGGFGGGFDGGGFAGAGAGAGSSFSLNLIEAGVSFVNRNGGGSQLLVRSQSQINGLASQIQTVRLPAAVNLRNQDANFRPNLLAQGGGTIDLATIVELQVQGNPNAALRLNQLELEFTSNSGNVLGGGFGGGLGGGFGPPAPVRFDGREVPADPTGF